jgi:hypothetical protein
MAEQQQWLQPFYSLHSYRRISRGHFPSWALAGCMARSPRKQQAKLFLRKKVLERLLVPRGARGGSSVGAQLANTVSTRLVNDCVEADFVQIEAGEVPAWLFAAIDRYSGGEAVAGAAPPAVAAEALPAIAAEASPAAAAGSADVPEDTPPAVVHTPGRARDRAFDAYFVKVKDALRLELNLPRPQLRKAAWRRFRCLSSTQQAEYFHDSDSSEGGLAATLMAGSRGVASWLPPPR